MLSTSATSASYDEKTIPANRIIRFYEVFKYFEALARSAGIAISDDWPAKAKARARAI